MPLALVDALRDAAENGAMQGTKTLAIDDTTGDNVNVIPYETVRGDPRDADNLAEIKDSFSAAQTGQPFQNVAVNGANVGFGYASFLLGQVNSVGIANPVEPRLGKHQIGLFVQDSWKVTRKLTFDYGVRYDYSTYLREQYGRAAERLSDACS